MTQFLSNMSQTLAADVASALVYLAIAVLFAICLVKCIGPVLNTKRVLRRAAHQIRQGESAKRSWQEEGFLGKGALYPHWREYLNNLFFADGEFHNPSNVEDFINEDTAIYGPGRAQFSDAAPGIMVSLGFLGTLIGISTGLRGFRMDDAEQVMNAIRQLVPGMQYAFMTSIVGVIGSISFTLINRVASGSALRALTAFYAAMKENAGVVSVDPMTQIAIYQQEQTALISQMAEGLKSDMIDRMGQGIAMAISKSYQGLQNSLDEFMTYATREQLRGVDIIVQRFLHEMNAAMDGQFENLGRVLAETARNQHAMVDGIKQALDGVTRVSHNVVQASQLSDAFVGKLDAYVGKLNASSQKAEEGYERMNAGIEHLELVTRQFNGYLQSVGKLQGEVTASLERFEVTGEHFMRAFMEQSQSASRSMGDAAGAIKQSGDVLAANHKALVGGISKDIDRTYNTFFKTSGESLERMGWVLEDMKNVIGRMPDTVDGAADLYARQADRLTDALRRAQDALDEAVDRLSQAMYPNR